MEFIHPFFELRCLVCCRSNEVCLKWKSYGGCSQETFIGSLWVHINWIKPSLALLIDSLFLVIKHPDTFAALAVWKTALMTQACSAPYFSRPPLCYFLPSSDCFSLRFYSLIHFIFFKLFKYLAALLTVRFPPHIGSAGLFCPQNAAEICSSPNQMAAFTERSVTPVPHHMTFASLGASAAQGPPSSSSMPRRGLRVWVAPLLWQAKFF